jgi:hypothetical protein
VNTLNAVKEKAAKEIEAKVIYIPLCSLETNTKVFFVLFAYWK